MHRPRTLPEPTTARATRAVLALALLAGAACADSATGPGSSLDARGVRPVFDVATGTTSIVRVCKDPSSPAGTYSFTAGVTGNVNVGDVLVSSFTLSVPGSELHPSCVDAYTRVQADAPGSDEPATVVITELASAGTTLSNITVSTLGPNAPIPGSVVDLAARTVIVQMNAFHGVLTTYFNSTAHHHPPPPPVHGCTYTQGWYKNKGASSLPSGNFALSGQTYLGVLNTAPKGGNPYYILAHQYIAATENVEGGASTTLAVQQALAGAAAYFAVATPANPLPGSYTKEQLTGWAATLDAFNNGLLGPPHCD